MHQDMEQLQDCTYTMCCHRYLLLAAMIIASCKAGSSEDLYACSLATSTQQVSDPQECKSTAAAAPLPCQGHWRCCEHFDCQTTQSSHCNCQATEPRYQPQSPACT
jgi:hypothetical protein